MAQRFIKDPESQLDYTFDWIGNGFLSVGEDITASTWFIDPAGSTSFQIVSVTNTSQSASVTVSGGEHGDDFWITNQITTNVNSRIVQKSINIKIWEPI
jgi:LEA14-like dessication related protein